MVNGSDEQKYNWIFDLYDLNGDGHISKDEMEDVVHSVIQTSLSYIFNNLRILFRYSIWWTQEYTMNTWTIQSRLKSPPLTMSDWSAGSAGSVTAPKWFAQWGISTMGLSEGNIYTIILTEKKERERIKKIFCTNPWYQRQYLIKFSTTSFVNVDIPKWDLAVIIVPTCSILEVVVLNFRMKSCFPGPLSPPDVQFIAKY